MGFSVRTKKKQLSDPAFLKRVKDTIKQYGMIAKGDRVLVAVSGGPDSVCLLKALHDLARKLDIELVVANMDHCLRGKESEKDSMFVRELAEDMALPFVHKKINVKSAGKKGASVEEKAREKRYEFFKEGAVAERCGVIATGHSMDDQAETVLMRVIYGSSLSGLAGIHPVRFEKGLKIIRPLIRVSRREILGFLGKSAPGYVEDSSNRDMRFLRNSVREEVLPFLEKYNPRLKRSLANLSDALREDLAFLEAEKERTMKKHVREKQARVDIRDLILQPKAVRREVFKELFARSGGNVKKLTYRHWMDMDHFLRAAVKNRSLDLPGNVSVTKRDGELFFRKRAA